MRVLSIGEKLEALSTVSLRSGISTANHGDIARWRAEAGDKLDTTVLSTKTIERIQVLYNEFFEG